LLKALRGDLRAAGVVTQAAGSEELYGVHAFRRGAAQAMARAGWSESTIKSYLRWESGCVALYIAEAPLALSRRFAASLWGKPGQALGEEGAQGSLAQLQAASATSAEDAERPKKRRRRAPPCGDLSAHEKGVEMQEAPPGASQWLREAKALSDEVARTPGGLATMLGRSLEGVDVEGDAVMGATPWRLKTKVIGNAGPEYRTVSMRTPKETWDGVGDDTEFLRRSAASERGLKVGGTRPMAPWWMAPKKPRGGRRLPGGERTRPTLSDLGSAAESARALGLCIGEGPTRDSTEAGEGAGPSNPCVPEFPPPLPPRAWVDPLLGVGWVDPLLGEGWVDPLLQARPTPGERRGNAP
jgi:hypothetical protein